MVGREGGVDLQPPYDLHFGFDYFSDDGRKFLEELENDPLLAAKQWAPCCKLFSRARGRSITLPSGRVIQGPQPVRDRGHLMGFSNLSADMKQRLRKSNKMALKAIRRLESAQEREAVATLEHPYNSWLWYCKPIMTLAEDHFDYAAGSMCCFGGERTKWYNGMHSSAIPRKFWMQ